MTPFVPLHVHTTYSLLDGACKIGPLAARARALGMSALAITDHGDLFGLKAFHDACRLKKDKAGNALPPLKPILGCEAYVARRTRHDKNQDGNHREDASGSHLILLAKNKAGYHNLVRLASLARIEGMYYKPRIDHELLEKYHEGLIVSSACIAGEVASAFRDGNDAEAERAARWYRDLFGEDYYLEVMLHRAEGVFVDDERRRLFEDQARVNAKIFALGAKLGIKVVATNDTHFLLKEDAEAHDILLCLSTQSLETDLKRLRYTRQEWLKSGDEMAEVFPDRPEALANTLEVAEKVEDYDLDSKPIMPVFPIPEDFGTDAQYAEKYPTPESIRPKFEPKSFERFKGDTPEGLAALRRILFEGDYLRKRTYDGAARRWPGEKLDAEHRERLDFELSTILNMGFPGYFLIVQDFINSARNELGVMVGPGRGSAAGSVVAYCLGITKIDPIKYDLLFERFLNPDRISLPDIDTDFDDDGRGRVLQWVEEKYGYENCAHIITYATMATKNSIKDVARVEKVPIDMANALCKAIPDRLPDGMKMNLTNAIKCTPMLQDAEVSDDTRLRNTIKYAKMLEGTIRGTGIHACGFIICRDPISQWVPVSTADDPDFKGRKVNCTQYDGHVIEETGLIKMDFLGLKTLSELKEAVENIRLRTGKVIDLDTIPIDDPKTYELYQKGQTIGTFQFESSGMQNYLRQLHPTVFEDLIAMNALYRPGPMDYIPDFIKRKNDPSLVKYDIPCMEKYLKDTYGITVYQEQVMLLSRQLAGFTRGQSDALRKAMGKKKKAIVDKMRPMFIEGGKKNGHDPQKLEKIWSDWEKFASYAFNKSHATCYSWVAYQTAYLKANYPADFMAAIMSRRKDQITEITKLMDECRALGIMTLGPDVNESRMKFTVNAHGEIRFGLAGVKGMGEAPANSIIEEREKNGLYRDIYDFVERVNLRNVNRRVMESLAYSGGFDSFGYQREQYFAVNSKGEVFLDTLLRYGALYQQEQAQAMNSLFGGANEVEIAHPPVPKAERWPAIEKLNRERDLVGIYLSAHPLDEYDVVLNNLCNTRCSEIGRDADKTVLEKREEITFGGIVTKVVERFSQKSGKPFGFVTIEDFESSGELALFGDDWLRWNNMLKENYTVYVTAKMTERFRNSGMKELKVQNVEQLYDVKAKRIERLTLMMNAYDITDETVANLTSMIQANTGDTPLFVQINTGGPEDNILLGSKAYKVNVDRKFLQSLAANESIRYRIN